MDLMTFGAILVTLFVGLLCFFGLTGSKPSSPNQGKAHKVVEEEEEEEEEGRTAERTARTTPSTRRRWRPNRGPASSTVASSSGAVEEPVHQGAGDGEEDDDEEDGEYYVARGASKKEAKRQQREANRQAEAAQRELKREKEDKSADLRKQRDEAREAEEKRKEEEHAEQKRIEEEHAQAEYAQWKGAFTLETEGTVESDVQEQSQGLLQEFVDHIKKHKLVVLEDLAAEFGLRTQDVVNRVTALEQMGRITGVMDERGKFVYISPEEMKAVADYIKSVGRVSIAQLARKSNEFIDLVPKTVPISASCADEISVEASQPSMGVDAIPPTLVM